MAQRAKRVGRLDTLAAVRTELARLYRDGRHKKEDDQVVARLSGVLKALAEVIRVSEIEPRLAALEAQAQAPGTTVVEPPRVVYVDGRRVS
jgi:hypothetical protein